MDLNEIIAALKARCAAVFGENVSGAAEYKRLLENANLTVPAAYVIPMDENAGEQQSQNSYRQIITDTIAVVVVVSNAVDERGQGSITSIPAIRAALCAALCGWEPADHGPMQYDGGSLLDLDRARLYYQFEFSADTELSEADTWLAARNAALPDLSEVGIDVDTITPFDPNRVAADAAGPDGTKEASVVIAIPTT